MATPIREYEAAQKISLASTRGVSDYLTTVSNELRTSSVAIWTLETGAFKRSASRGSLEGFSHHVKVRSGVVGRTVLDRPVWWRDDRRTTDANGDPIEPFNPAFLQQFKIQQVLALPVKRDGQTIGAISLYWLQPIGTEYVGNLVQAVLQSTAERFVTARTRTGATDDRVEAVIRNADAIATAGTTVGYIHDLIRATNQFNANTSSLLNGLTTVATVNAARATATAVLKHYAWMKEILDASHVLLKESGEEAGYFDLRSTVAALRRLVEVRYMTYDSELKRFTKGRSVELVEPASTPSVTVYGGKSALLRSMLNVYDNSVTWSEKGGQFFLEYDLDDERQILQVRMSDNGPGLSPHVDRSQLGNLFVTGRTDGLGIGLASLVGACRRFGWSWTFEPKSKRGGFGVTLSLPYQ